MILSTLEARGKVSVRELSDLLGVSEVTIRQDLSKLEQEQHVRRVRGGAALPLLRRAGAEERLSAVSTEQARIGRLAATLLEDDDVVILDAGAITREMARFVRPHVRDLVVITNGLHLALDLEKLNNVSVIVTGGILRGQHLNPLGEEILARFQVSKLFMDCAGVSAERGVTTRNLPEAEAKQRMIDYADELYLLVESAKLGVVSNVRLCPTEKVRAIVTDRNATAEQLAPFQARGIGVRIA